MGRVRKHYVMRCASLKRIDRWIVPEFRSWLVFLSREAPTFEDRQAARTVIELTDIPTLPWRRKLLMMWGALKPHSVPGRMLGSVVLKEFSHRSGRTKDAYIAESKCLRGSIRLTAPAPPAPPAAVPRPRGGVLPGQQGLRYDPPDQPAADQQNNFRQLMSYARTDAMFLRPRQVQATAQPEPQELDWIADFRAAVG